MKFILREADGEIKQCDSCDFPAPTAEFDWHYPAQPKPGEPHRLLCEFCCTTMGGRYTGNANMHGMAALIAHIRSAATAAERARCLACVPGGSWVDPQQVADEIRRGS